MSSPSGSSARRYHDSADSKLLLMRKRYCLAVGDAQGETEDGVVFAVEHGVARRVGAERVPVEREGAQRCVLLDIEEGAVVGGPVESIAGAGQPFGQQLAGGEVLDVEGVLEPTRFIQRVSEVTVVVARRVVAQRQVLAGDGVEIEQHLLRRVEAAPLAAEDVVVAPFLGADVVEDVAHAEGDARIGALHAADDFSIERLAQSGRGRHHRLGVGVLGSQVGDRLRVGRLLQPGVGVFQLDVAEGEGMRQLPGDRRRQLVSVVVHARCRRLAPRRRSPHPVVPVAVMLTGIPRPSCRDHTPHSSGVQR